MSVTPPACGHAASKWESGFSYRSLPPLPSSSRARDLAQCSSSGEQGWVVRGVWSHSKGGLSTSSPNHVSEKVLETSLNWIVPPQLPLVQPPSEILQPKQPSQERGGLFLLLHHLFSSIRLNVSSWETREGPVPLPTLWARLKTGPWKPHPMVAGDTDSPTDTSKPCLTLHLYLHGCHDAISASLCLLHPSVQNAKCSVPCLFK